MKSVTLLIALPLLLQLSGCGMLDMLSHQSSTTNTGATQSTADKIKALEIPPDLTHPQQNEAYRIPVLSPPSSTCVGSNCGQVAGTAPTTSTAQVASAAGASPANSGGTLLDRFQTRLQMLDKLKAEGLITDDEYRDKRQAILKQL